MNCVYVTIIIIVEFLSSSISGPIASFPGGKIEGITLKTSANTTFYGFRNIPYGQPPIGNLRFQSPKPANPWTGIRDGTKDGNSCIYLSYFNFYPDPGPMSEDCLYLNVYTPDWDASQKLPVMFWIYGGGFRSGSGIYKYYGPQNLIDENIVVVTFNYRIGPFGFLSTGDDAIPGNAGLKDQALALSWTKDNIGYFGGDSEKITIFGESAGGMSVGLHVVSKQSAGLFRGAICHSGCTLSVTFSPDPKYFIYNLSRVIDSTITEKTSTEQIRDLLVNVSADDLVNASSQVDLHTFVPVLEAEDKNAFISQPVYELLEKGKVNGEALLLGINSEESLAFIEEENLKSTAKLYDENIVNLIPDGLKPKNTENITEIAEEIRKIYKNDNETFIEDLGTFLEYYSDNIFVRATYKQAELQSKFQTVYQYQFSFYGTTSHSRYIVEGAGKVGHFDELSYLFLMTQYPLKTEEDDLTRRRFSKLWANFAKYLNPTPEKIDLLQNVTWPKVVANNVSYMDIDNNLIVRPSRKIKEIAAWTKIWEKYATKPFNTF